MIRCPITNTDIDIGECVTIVDISEGCIKESLLPGDIRKVNDWKNICKNCENHNN